MSDLVPNFEQFAHVPTAVEHPVLAASAVVASVAVGVVANRIFAAKGEGFYAKSTNPALVDHVAAQGRVGSDAPSESPKVIPKEASSDRHRMLPVYLGIGGLGLAAASWLAHPTYTQDIPNSGANVVVVQDVSSSMALTHDMADGKQATRLSASIAAIKASASFPGSLGYIQVGSDVKIAVPLEQNWQADVKHIDETLANPNGGAIVAALQQAEQLLPIDHQSKSTTSKNPRLGEIILISDGSVDDSAAEISGEATSLQNDGVKVTVVVPGTQEGTYVPPNTNVTTKSAIEPANFAGFGANNVKIADGAKAIMSSVSGELSNASTQHESVDWKAIEYLGGLLAISGGTALAANQVTRKV